MSRKSRPKLAKIMSAVVGTILVYFGLLSGIITLATHAGLTIKIEEFIGINIIPVTLGYWLVRRTVANNREAILTIIGLVIAGF